MKRIKFWTLVIIVISFLFVEFFPGNAEAIPAFARKFLPENTRPPVPPAMPHFRD